MKGFICQRGSAWDLRVFVGTDAVNAPTAGEAFCRAPVVVGCRRADRCGVRAGPRSGASAAGVVGCGGVSRPGRTRMDEGALDGPRLASSPRPSTCSPR